jgi:hypothetical protein
MRIYAVRDYMQQYARLDSAHVRYAILGKSDEWYDLHFPGAHIQQRCVDIRVQFKKKKAKK